MLRGHIRSKEADLEFKTKPVCPYLKAQPFTTALWGPLMHDVGVGTRRRVCPLSHGVTLSFSSRSSNAGSALETLHPGRNTILSCGSCDPVCLQKWSREEGCRGMSVPAESEKKARMTFLPGNGGWAGLES